MYACTNLHAATDGAEPLDVVPVQGPVDQARHVSGQALQNGSGNGNSNVRSNANVRGNVKGNE